LTPEDETKLLLNSSATDQQQLKPENRDNNIIIGDDNDDDNIKRRSSAGTYSLSSDSQPDCNNAAGIIPRTYVHCYFTNKGSILRFWVKKNLPRHKLLPMPVEIACAIGRVAAFC